VSNLTNTLAVRTNSDLAGSLPEFPGVPGSTLPASLPVRGFQQKRLLFNRLGQPGQVHVYRTDCRAGDRLRVQMLVPVLPLGGSVVPALPWWRRACPTAPTYISCPSACPLG